MTGEITLHGNVLPIGGLKEKSMAAFREGISTVLIPKENATDLYEVDAEVKEKIHFIRWSACPRCSSMHSSCPAMLPPAAPTPCPGHQPDRRRKARRQGPGHCNVKEPL